MKKILVVVLCLFTLLACSKLDSEIQKDIDSNPFLKQNNISVKVVSVDNGYVKLLVERGFDDRVMSMIRSGKSVRDIWLFADMRIEPLVKLEEVIKKRPEVKDITWSAK